MADANTSRAQSAEGSQTTPNGTNSSMDPSSCNKLASEVAFLQDVLSSPPPTEAEAGSNIAALLKQLDTADGVAQGVESRLDKLLRNLEGLLEGLEGKAGGAPEGGQSNNGLDVSKSSQPQQEGTHEKDVG